VKRSNRLVILVGVLLAVLAFVLVVILLNTGQEVTPPTERPVKVVIATEDIEVGDPVGPDQGEVREVPQSGVVGMPIGDPSQLTNSPALVPIPAGSQISKEMVGGLSTTPTINVEAQLQPGEKAVAFQVDRVTGLDFIIQPGDRIDIVLTQQVQVLQPTADTADLPRSQQRFETLPGLENARTVKTILQDKRVLYVSATRVRQIATGAAASPSPGQAQAQQAQQQLENVIIVFAGSDQDAEVIKFAQNDLGELGSLTAILRRVEDTAEEVRNERTTGITIDILFEEYGIPVPGIIRSLGPGGRR
jgi:Flp pilus assembly protein CpaB